MVCTNQNLINSQDRSGRWEHGDRRPMQRFGSEMVVGLLEQCYDWKRVEVVVDEPFWREGGRCQG